MDAILKPQQLDLYRNSNKEPQYVTSKEPNRGIVYIESFDNIFETNLVAMNCSTITSAGEYPSNLAYGVTRLSVNAFGVRMCIPNVNPRNNTIRFFSSASGSYHSVDLIEGFYQTTLDLITHVVNKLNTVSGASLLTFSFIAVTAFPDRYDLNSAGGNYYFDTTCSAITHGYQLYCLPSSQVASNSKIVGSMGLFYTAYIDLCSATLTKYVKIRSVSTSKTSNLVVRMHFGELPKPNEVVYLTKSTSPDVQLFFNHAEPINTIDFELRDQFGELLYAPQNSDGTFRGFWWNCSILIEC